MMQIALNATSQSIDIRIVDDSGLPVPSLVAATMPTLVYSKAGANADVTISPVDLASLATAWTSGGVKERGNGVYRLDMPNAAFTTQARVTLRGEATDKRVIVPVIDVVGDGGTGARLVAITVNDGATALENATVRMTQGGESYAVLTNVSGVAVFALDDATWTVTVTKAGYTLAPTTIIVNGTETATYSMTAVTITPSDPGETTGYVTIRTLAGVEVSGVVVDVEVTRWANGTTGSGITPRMRSRTTDVNGYAEFTGLPRLATYRVRVDGGEWTSSAVTLDAATTPLTAPIGPVE